MGTREYKFITGVESADLPEATTPTVSSDIMTLGYAQSNFAAKAPTVVGTRAAPQAITAAGGIAFTGSNAFTTWFIQGSGGNITVTSNPKIAAGTVLGQKLRLIVPATATYSVTLNDGTGLELNGVWVGGPSSALELEWDGTNWFETSRR